MSDIINTLGTRQDFQVYNNATFGGFTTECTVNGAPEDLAGATVEMAIRKNTKDNETISKLLTSTGGDITILTPTTDAKEQIEPFLFNFGEGTYFYDIKTTYSDGKVRYHNYGYFYCEQNVTE